MNKKLKILVTSLVLISSIGLIGCIDKKDDTQTNSKPGVEKENDKTDKESEDETIEKEDEESNTNGSTDNKPSTGNDKPSTEKPNTEKPQTEQYSYDVYSLDETVSFLEKKTKSGDKEEILKPWSVFWQVQSNGQISKNAKVLTFEVNNNNIGVLDVSKEMYEEKLGSGVESLVLESLAKTFMSAYKVDGLIVKVEGKLYSSGHIILEEGKYFK
ncbi:MAG: hypothetical protein ACRC57_14575 [Sarcina sp.]